MEKIYLTKDKSCWLRLHDLSADLLAYSNENYEAISALSEDNTSDSVQVMNKETGKHEKKKIFRKFKSYGKTPEFDKDGAKSYMFSGAKSYMFASGEKSKSYMFSSGTKSYMFSGDKDDSDINSDIPDVFKPIQDYVEKELEQTYNQAVVNWYRTGDEYIEMHSDCTSAMIDSPSIVIVNLNDPKSKQDRVFKLKAKYDSSDDLMSNLNLSLRHGRVIEMGGSTQDRFRHGVEKGKSRRVSFTLRQMA